MRTRAAVIALAVLATGACELIVGIDVGEPLPDTGDSGADALPADTSFPFDAKDGPNSDAPVSLDGSFPEFVACDPDCGCDQQPVSGAEAQVFKDVLPQTFGADAVLALHAAGIVGVCQAEPALFCPTCFLSRADLAKWLVLVASLTPSAPTTPTFIDVSQNHPYYVFIETVVAHGLATGFPGGEFRPYDQIPRNTAAIWVANARQLPAARTSNQSYADVPPGVWGHGSIEALTQACYVVGCDPTAKLFCPSDPLIRRNGAVWVARAFDYVASACEPSAAN